MRVRSATSSNRRKSRAAQPDCASAFQSIGLHCVTAIKAHHTGACSGDAEAVHQIRIAITRLRAAVLFFKPIVADAQWSRLKRDIAWLNGPLGAARDSDVMLEYARRKSYRAWTGRLVGEGMERLQTRQHRRLVRALRSARTLRLMTAMAKWLRQGRWLKRFQQDDAAEALPVYCARRLEHWRRRLVRHGRNLEKLGTSALHEVRIKAKRLRYMLEALRETGVLPKQGGFRRLQRPARQLQRALGDLRDLTRFAELARPRGGKRSKRYPPAYRRRLDELFAAAVAARLELKRVPAR
jgi:CHAD domain-containing protein